MRSDNQVEGVVEIFQRPDAQPVTQRGYLKFLMQMCELAAEWLKTRKLRQISTRHSLWEQADHFARLVHEQLDVRETAYVIVNEGRRMVGCDRVSVGLMRGRICKIEAISGQDTIENRSNIVNHLGKLATRVVATGESLWYDGTDEELHAAGRRSAGPVRRRVPHQAAGDSALAASQAHRGRAGKRHRRSGQREQ